MEPLSWSAGDLARKIEAGRITSEAYCWALVERVEANRALNAYATFDADFLLEAARQSDQELNAGRKAGPLHGVPLIIKDNINTTALPTSGGTPALKDNLPKADAPLVSRLLGAGALIAGKANLHELSAGGTSANHTFGRIGNPYDTARVPGGSSGGTAAAVAARLAPAGIGSDTMGSVRVPASLCGLFGFRPSVGRYSADGIVPLSSSFDTAGPMARSMDDIVLLDSIMADHSASLPDRDMTSVHIGVAEDLIADTEAGSASVIQQALTDLEKAGVTLKPLDLSLLRDLQQKAGANIIDVEFERTLRAYLKDHAPDLSLEDVAAQIASPAARDFTFKRLGKAFDPAVYHSAQNEGRKMYDTAWQALFDDHDIDAVAFPTTPEVALPLAEDDNVLKDGEFTFSWFYFRHTALASHGRHPGLSLPVGLSSDGLPVGLELDGLPGKDELLLSAARAVAPVFAPLPAPGV
jgi:Asp-tRNA(Asn)/Glu-tRNA(Gln) amidotransferase A subunit family amidase